MKETINWLIGIEALAASAYEQAAKRVCADTALHALLLELAADERRHEAILESALNAVSDTETSIVLVDEATKLLILKRFNEFSGFLSRSELPREALLQKILGLEFTELNDFFLYFSSRGGKTSSHIANEVTAHKDRILSYLASLGDGGNLMQKAGLLPKISAERILVVDDKDVNAALLQAVLEHDASVDISASAEEALARLEAVPFSAVIADIHMPIMSGIDLYKKAVAKRPELKNRFVFYTGAYDTETLAFLKANDLVCLMKPASISVIRKTVGEVIKGNHRAS